MAFVHGKDTKVLFDEYDLSGYHNSVNITRPVQVVSADVFDGSGAKSYIQGLEEATVSIGGLWDGTGNDAYHHSKITSPPELITVGIGGLTVGNVTKSMNVYPTGYQVRSTVNDAVRITANGAASAGLASGFSLHDLTEETGDSNSASIDNGASSAFGGVGFLHVTGDNAGSALVVRIQDSTDDAAWSDLISFTSTDTVTSERLTVSGTVNRYVRAIWTRSAGAFTFTVAFSRNTR